MSLVRKARGWNPGAQSASTTREPRKEYQLTKHGYLEFMRDHKIPHREWPLFDKWVRERQDEERQRDQTFREETPQSKWPELSSRAVLQERPRTVTTWDMQADRWESQRKVQEERHLRDKRKQQKLQELERHQWIESRARPPLQRPGPSQPGHVRAMMLGLAYAQHPSCKQSTQAARLPSGVPESGAVLFDLFTKWKKDGEYPGWMNTVCYGSGRSCEPIPEDMELECEVMTPTAVPCAPATVAGARGRRRPGF